MPMIYIQLDMAFGVEVMKLHIIFYIFSIKHILLTTKNIHGRIILFTTKSVMELDLKYN